MASSVWRYRAGLLMVALFGLSVLLRLAPTPIHTIREACRSNEPLKDAAGAIEQMPLRSEDIDRMQKDMQENPQLWLTPGDSSGGRVSREQAAARLRAQYRDDAEFERRAYAQFETQREDARQKLPWAVGSIVVMAVAALGGLVVVVRLWNAPPRVVSQTPERH